MRWPLLLRLCGLALMGLLLALTLYVQAFWQTSGIRGVLLGAVWLALLAGWRVWHRALLGRQENLRRGAMFLPACFAFVVVCQIGHLPLRVVFWTQRAALEKALRHAPVSREAALRQARPQARIGSFRPLQISKSGKATRIILWENEEFLSGTAVGFAYCPGDSGCSAATFDMFHFDSEGEPRMVRMSGEWVAVAVYGSDM